MLYCKKCGKKIDDESAQFCSGCGAALMEESGSSQNKDNSTHSSLKTPMFIISAVSFLGSILVYLYGHNVFYDDVWISSSPQSRFWERGNGISVFIALLVLGIVFLVLGLFSKNKK